jgi:hypothetical protein
MVEALHGQINEFESPVGLGTGEEAHGAVPLEQQLQEARPLGASMLGKGLGDLDPEVKSPAGSRCGAVAKPPTGALLVLQRPG